jgi:hypothetical protein
MLRWHSVTNTGCSTSSDHGCQQGIATEWTCGEMKGGVEVPCAGFHSASTYSVKMSRGVTVQGTDGRQHPRLGCPQAVGECVHWMLGKVPCANQHSVDEPPNATHDPHEETTWVTCDGYVETTDEHEETPEVLAFDPHCCRRRDT